MQFVIYYAAIKRILSQKHSSRPFVFSALNPSAVAGASSNRQLDGRQFDGARRRCWMLKSALARLHLHQHSRLHLSRIDTVFYVRAVGHATAHYMLTLHSNPFPGLFHQESLCPDLLCPRLVLPKFSVVAVLLTFSFLNLSSQSPVFLSLPFLLTREFKSVFLLHVCCVLPSQLHLPWILHTLYPPTLSTSLNPLLTTLHVLGLARKHTAVGL